MRLTSAVLGIASTALWGCKEKVSVEDLEKQIAGIKKDFDGKLHALEIGVLDDAGDFHDMRSSDRRFAKKLMNRVYKDKNSAVTKADIEAAIAELEQLGGAGRTVDEAKAALAQFDTLNPDQNARIGAFLRTEIERRKEFAARIKAVTDRIPRIKSNFGANLLSFELQLLDRIQQEPLRFAAESKFFTELLDKIYDVTPKFKAVTKVEIEEMLKKTDGKSEYTGGTGLEYVLDNYEKVPEPALKRVKGWFKYLDRKVAEYEASKQANVSV